VSRASFKVEPGVVRRSGRVVEHGREQRLRQRVGGEDIQASVVDEGRDLGHPIEDACHVGPDPLGAYGGCDRWARSWGSQNPRVSGAPGANDGMGRRCMMREER